MSRGTSLLRVALAAGVLTMGLLANPAVSTAAPGPPGRFASAPRSAGGFSGVAIAQPSFFSSFGFPGGYASPFLSPPSLPPPYPYMPNYWWVGPYPTADPRQSGYNPASGYRWDEVTALILDTNPKNAHITLDGVDIGQSSELGPIQLPFGEHSLRVEAAGYEPSETVLKVERPILQQLEIRLQQVNHTPKPGPRR